MFINSAFVFFNISLVKCELKLIDKIYFKKNYFCINYTGKFMLNKGILKEIREESLDILIITEPVCFVFKPKHLCGMSEAKEKIITITKPKQQFETDENVEVIMSQKLDNLTMIYAYILAFIIMLSIMLAVYYTKTAEPVLDLS